MTSRTTRGLLGLVSVACCGLSSAFPSRPMTIVAPAPPGGIADMVVRTPLPRPAAALGPPVLVENRAGVSGAIAPQAVAVAPPDRHTLLMNCTSHVINPWPMAKLPCDSEMAFLPVASEVRAS
jgi:tripartite-type tricarboxylate transporter receptor subunit TctC